MMENLEESSESLHLNFEQAIADGDVEAVRKLVTRSSHDFTSGDGLVNATALFLLSVQGGNIDIIESVLQLRPPPDVHFVDDKDRRPLHFAAETGSLSVVKTILNLGSAVNISDVDGRTPMMIAASKGYADIVECFIKKGSRLNLARQRRTQNSILHLAAQEGHLGVVEVLIKHGADVNCQTLSEKGGLTVLHNAVLGGNTEVVKLLCANGADLSRTDALGQCPFHMAAEKGLIDMVRAFLDIGADVNWQTQANEGGWSVLHTAVLDGNTQLVKLLCAYGADQSRTDAFGRCAFHMAAHKGHIDMVRTFIDIGADLEMRDGTRRTPLVQAVLGQAEEVVAYLLKCGADVAAVDEGGYQSLHHAAAADRVDIVQMLIKHGADVDPESITENTPLMQACLAGSPSVVEHLIAHGVDVNKVDVNRRTALHNAQLCCKDMKIKEKLSLRLIAAGAKINPQDKHKSTPLRILLSQCVQFREPPNAIKIFVRYGLQPSFTTFPLRWLTWNGFYEAARCLVLAGWNLRQEKWLNLPGKSAEHSNFLAWLRSQITEPKPLAWLCRHSIRRTLIQLSDGKEILSKVTQLPVPPPVMSFINLDDI